ncbi:MAG: DUF2911 domain-containing protein [Bryobacteraceae bacterium]
MTRRLAMILSAASPLLAHSAMQDNSKRASPHETASIDLNGKKISISYGRPYLKGRELGHLTPDGQVWRLGADEATKLTVTARTSIANTLDLAPGSYSMFAITNPDKWTIIINKVANQWGAFSYKESEDLGRFDVPVKSLPTPVEQFTITLNKQSSDVAELTLAWGKSSVSTTLKVL